MCASFGGKPSKNRAGAAGAIFALIRPGMANPSLFDLFRTRALSALMTCGLLAACGGTAVRDDEPTAAAGARSNPVESAGVGGEAAAGNAGTEPGGAGGDGPLDFAGAPPFCPPGLPSAAEIAATPRADQNLELLALRIAGGIVADQGTYDRVVRDVGAIRELDDRVAGIQYFPQGDGKSIGLAPDAATYTAMHAGQYRAWDCLNQTYVVTDTVFQDAKPPFEANVYLTLKGIYDITTVVMQYGALVGVKAFDNGPDGGDGPTICVTRESDVWHYVFDQAGGDCPSGCTEHTYYHFTTTAAGVIASLGEIPDTEDSPYTSNEACR